MWGRAIAEFDEVVLTNDTWFGPVRPYGPVLERMGERAVHFWGMTDHAREEPNPFTHKGVLPYHLQSFWIAVRREMFLSEAWAAYWRELPPMPSYFDAVLEHEALFTERFSRPAATPTTSPTRRPTTRPTTLRCSIPICLLADGCPVLKRRPFFHYPPFLDRHAVIGRADPAARGRRLRLPARPDLAEPRPQRAAESAERGCRDARGAPRRRRLVRPRQRPLRIVAVAHVRGAERRRRRAGAAGGDVRRPSTSSSRRPIANRLDSLRALVDELDARARRVAREVRLVPARRGRDMSAFFVGCRDVLTPRCLRPRDQGAHPHARGALVEHGALLPPLSGREPARAAPGYVANVLGLFQREPGLGVVFPPMIHIGYATPGPGRGCPTASGPSSCARGSASASRSTASPRSRRSAACGSRGRRRCGCSSTRDWEYRGLRRSRRGEGDRPARACRSASSPAPRESSASMPARS